MAVTSLYGFEAAAAAVDGITLTGTAAYSTTQARTGSRSIRCNPGSGASGYVGLSLSTYVHFALYVASLPSVDRRLTGSTNDRIELTSSGALKSYNSLGNEVGTSSAVFATPGWHSVSVRFGTIPAGSPHVKIDDVTEITGNDTLVGQNGVLGLTSTEASAADIYIDDVIADPSNFLAPSKVALLLPISDNYRGALWTAGAGGTTNLWDAVNNVPPAGLATETNTSQIEHAGGGTDYYDANMTTYTDAGVNSGDTVLAVQGLIVWGEDSASGTKLGAYNGQSNPAWTGESSIDVSSGDGTGATLNYGAGPPDYWNERRSPIMASPSVTLGTSPVYQAWRPESASRVMSVCFMGMLVAWTPAAADRAPLPTYNRRVIQAVNRSSVY